MLLLHGMLSYSAARTKSAVFDEPLNLVAGHLGLHRRDFRAEPQDPALFMYLAGLTTSENTVRIDRTSEHFAKSLNDNEARYMLTMEALYGPTIGQADTLVQRGRVPFVIVSILFGAVLVAWAYQLAGPLASVAAAMLYSLDPTVLGHGPLVKNDVILAGWFVLASMLAWHVGRRATVPGVLTLGIVCGLTVSTKLSGLLLIGVVGVLLLARAALPISWPVLRRELATRSRRFIAATVMLAVIGVTIVLVVWASYGFRFSATPDPSLRADWDAMEATMKLAQAVAEGGGAQPAPENVQRQTIGLFPRAVRRAAELRLMPEAWLYGLQFVQAFSVSRQSFLLGQIVSGGHWYYFPVAMLFKTPVAVLIALLAVPAMVLWLGRRTIKPSWWPVLCIGVPIAVYMGTSMRSDLNLGVRHVLPVYLLLHVALACGVAHLLTRQLKAVRMVVIGLAVALIAEVAAAWPDYIAFFNVPSGGHRGGMRLLSDTNLDWGQDLKALARWQQQNPDVKLYLCYFGVTDPAAYGIRRVDLPGGWAWARWSDDLREPGVIAVSATHLQGTYLPPQFRRFYQQLQQKPPIDILGGTIYLYEHAGRPAR